MTVGAKLPSAALKITKLDSDTQKPIAGAVFVGLNKEGQVVTKARTAMRFN